jgi:hypothetical protein
MIGMLPSMVSAKAFHNEYLHNDLLVDAWFSSDSSSFAMIQDDQEPKKKKGKTPEQEPEVDKEAKPKLDPKVADVETRRPNIKEVPKARPKLRPGVVDRVKVKRPPVRVKPRGGLRIGL